MMNLARQVRNSMVAWGVLLGLIVAAGAQQKATYKIVAPEIVAQGEEFTMRMVQATARGQVPIPPGATVFVNGLVLPADSSGKLQVPAFFQETGNQFLFITVRVGAEETFLEHHVEVIGLPQEPGQPPQISHVAELCPPGGNLRVEGQALNNLQNAALKGPNTTYSLDDSVGSSLQRIYTPPPGVPKGSYRFVAQDASGRSLEAPNQTTNPTLSLSGTQIQQRGERGQFVVTSDAEGDVQLSGGEPNIQLDSRTVHVAPGKPDTVPFTALIVGQYNVDAFLQLPDVPAAGAPPVDANVGELRAEFSPGAAATSVRAQVTVTGDRGQPVANTAVDVALAGPQGIRCSRITTDQDGHAAFQANLPGQVAADALTLHCYRVAGHPWNKNKQRKQQPPRYEYAVKFVCGAPEFPVVAPGRYFTAINVHNPGDKLASLRKKIAVALPGEKAGPVSGFFAAQLQPDEALEIDCPDILRHAQVQGFLKGFVVIESEVELDVVAVYTAGHDEVQTLDIERVPPRRVAPAVVVPPVLLPSRGGY